MVRGTVLAALFAVELVIVGEMYVALRSGAPASSFVQQSGAESPSGSRIVEDGPHRLFDTGPRPALSIDIGYADLTILTGDPTRIDVGVAASDDFGMLRATVPITARASGSTVRIATARRQSWSIGDDRMVTVIVPPGTRVTVITAGDIKANGLRGESSFSSVGLGSITIDDYDAPGLHVASKGRIALHSIATPQLDVTSSDGHVEGTALQVRDGSIVSDGHVNLGFASGSDALVTAETGNGRIHVSGVPITAATRNAGGDDDDDSASQTVRLGAGSGRLDVHANDGNITLAQDG